jgi:hypothetical protein
MPHSTYFVQGCPTCGRRLHVRVEYLGKKVVCQNCRGQFVACDGAGKRCGDGQPAGALLHRANELLKRAAEQVDRGRQSHPK